MPPPPLCPKLNTKKLCHSFLLYSTNAQGYTIEPASSHEFSVSVNISTYPPATSSHVCTCQTAKEIFAANRSMKRVKTGLQEHRTI